MKINSIKVNQQVLTNSHLLQCNGIYDVKMPKYIIPPDGKCGQSYNNKNDYKLPLSVAFNDFFLNFIELKTKLFRMFYLNFD